MCAEYAGGGREEEEEEAEERGEVGKGEEEVSISQENVVSEQSKIDDSDRC